MLQNVELRSVGLLCVPVCVASISMLDVRFYKGPRFQTTGCLDYSPYIKESARHVPLSGLSCHPPSVHDSWPRAEIARMHRLAYHKSSFEFFIAWKIKRFRSFFMHERRIRSCLDWKPTRRTSGKTGAGCMVRAFLPWHPALVGISSKLKKLAEAWNEELLFCSSGSFSPSLQVAYSLAGKPLHAVCRLATCG